MTVSQSLACNLFITVLYLHSSLSRFSSARKTYPNHYISNALVKTSNLELLKALFRRTDFYQLAGGVRMYKEQQKLPWMALLYKNKWLHKNLDIYHLVNLSQWNNPSRRQMRKPGLPRLSAHIPTLYEFFRSAEPHTIATHDGISRACMKKSFISKSGKPPCETAERRFVKPRSFVIFPSFSLSRSLSSTSMITL